MLKNFVSYQLALEFHASVRTLRCPAYLRSQLERAASSVALNLAEGAGRSTPRERRRFYEIAYSSARECQACLALIGSGAAPAAKLADRIGGAVFNLLRAT